MSEYDRVMVRRESDGWSVRKMNYHEIESGFETKQEAVKKANQTGRFVTVRE